jgi:hypothetical protein
VVACNLAKVDVPVRFRLPAPKLMNVNHEFKVVWWLPTRTASRSVGEILAYYKFQNVPENCLLAQMHTHSIGVPNGCEDYKIICNIRNPYAKVLSTWHLRYYKQDPITGGLVIEKSFDKYISQLRPENFEEHQIINQPRKPDLYIRTEHLVEDLHKVGFINFEDPSIQFIVDNWINKNTYTSEGCVENTRPDFDLKRDVKNPVMTDYLSYYNQEQLDIVWNLYKDVFNEFGYSREFI